MSHARLQWHLDNWAAWMRGRAVFLGYPSGASGGLRSTASEDFDDAVAWADNRCAAAVDAILGDLPLAQQCAVHTFALGAVWRFARIAPQALLALHEQALEAIRKGLTRRGIF